MSDYASLSNHFFPLLKYISVLFLFFIWLPKILFNHVGMDRMEVFFNGFIRMVLLLTTVVYVLAFAKLYEVLSLFLILAIFVYFRMLRINQIDSLSLLWGRIQILVFNALDGLAEVPDIVKLINEKIVRAIAFVKRHLLWVAVSGVVFGYAFWLRAYDAFMHAAPPLSDSYVTLAWMKYVSERALFHDGIYPQGFHIILSVLSKFSANNPLYVLKYTGPLCGLMTILGLWFFVFEITHSKTSAYFAAAVYGCTGLYFDLEMMRQAATNSQEFAMIFVLPTLWFLIRYYQSQDKRYLLTAGMGLCIMGAVHSLVLAFSVWLSAAIMLTYLLKGTRQSWQITFNVMVTGFIAIMLSLLPLAAGYLFGYEVHSSSAEYLLRVSSNIEYPKIGLRELIFIGGFLSTVLILIYEWFDSERRSVNFALIVLLLFAAIFYSVFPVITQSVVLDSRKSLLTLPFCGVAAGMIHWLIVRNVKGNLQTLTGLGMLLAVLTTIVITIRPAPFEPRKMERDVSVEAYLKIKQNYLPSTWMIVSQEEGYAMVLGSGYHMLVRNFINDIYLDNKTSRLMKKTGEPVNVEDVFIFYEKHVFRSLYTEIKDVYDRREKEMPQLLDFIKMYENRSSTISVYYEDSDLRIYHIHEELSQEDKFQKIWNQ